MTATDDLVSRLEGILDGGSRNISERYFEWIETTLSQTDWAKFETALDLGDFAHAAELIQWDKFDIEAELLNSFGKAADANSDYISTISAQSFRYDLKDPNALKWIEGHCAELVGQIDDPTQNAVREVIHRGYFEGYTTKQQAEIIQEFIGLSPKESERLADLATKLAADGVSQDDISRQIADEAAKSRKYRAGVIASNETSEAANRGQYFSTHNACSRGVIDPAKYEAYRIITNDDRTCDICLAVAGEARPLPAGVYPSSGDTIVKMHTSCRCAEGLRRISAKKAEGVIPFMDDNSEYKFSKIDVSFEAAHQKKTATSIFVPTVPVVEGVFWGHGIPVLRSFEKFGPESNWLDGIPVLINHEPLDPDARRVGQIRSPTPNEAERRIDAQTEFYRRYLTPEETEGIESGEALHGSLYLACYLNFESGVWTNPKTGESRIRRERRAALRFL